MKKLFCILVSFFLLIEISAQYNFNWAKDFQNNTDEQVIRDIALDGSDNSYSVGFFKGTIDFDPGAGTANLTSTGSTYDMFILKLDANGNYVWAKQIGSATGAIDTTFILRVKVLSTELYVTGSFTGTIDFDPGAGVVNLTSVGEDGFVLKLNTAGAFGGWVSHLEVGASNSIRVYDLEVLSGGIYVCGSFNGGIKYIDASGGMPVSVTVPSAGHDDSFVFVLHRSTGYGINFIHNASGADGNEAALNLEISSAANELIILGRMLLVGFSGTVDFDPGAGTSTLTYGGAEHFIQKLTLAGTLVDVEKFDITETALPSSAYINQDFMVIDNIGDIYIAGSSTLTIDVDPDPVNTYNVVGGIILIKLKNDLTFDWAFGTGTYSATRCYGLSINNPGDSLYMVGVVGEVTVVDVDPSAAVYNVDRITVPAVAADGLILSYDTSGAFLSALEYGQYIHHHDIEVTSNNHLICGGYLYPGTYDFDPGAATLNLTGPVAPLHGFYLTSLEVTSCGGDPTGTVTWTGSTSDDWHECVNWSPKVIPTLDSEVSVPNTTNKPKIYNPNIGDCFEIEIDSDNGGHLYIEDGAELKIHKP